ncbi:hypothetical protein TWF694_009007 [Orbilia ellipsospora]|uniref:Uncharacterized protein n=1 Tax=Orbilia ellipsospora TaxID=2528407 RepID=A0AAV9XDK5_9PEZI
MVCEYALFTFPDCQCPALLPVQFCDHHLNPEHPEYEEYPPTLKNPARITMLFKAPGVPLLHQDYMWAVKVYNDPMYLQDRSLTKQQADYLDWFQQEKVIEKLQGREEVFEDNTTHHTIGFHTKICRYHIIYPKCTDMYIWQPNEPYFFPFLESVCFTHSQGIVRDNSTGGFKILPSVVPETFPVPFDEQRHRAWELARKEVKELTGLDPGPEDFYDPGSPDLGGSEYVPGSPGSDISSPVMDLKAGADAKDPPLSSSDRLALVASPNGSRAALLVVGTGGEVKAAAELSSDDLSELFSSDTDVNDKESDDEYLPRHAKMKKVLDKNTKSLKKVKGTLEEREAEGYNVKIETSKSDEKKKPKVNTVKEKTATTIVPKKKPVNERKAKADSDSAYSDSGASDDSEEYDENERRAKPAPEKGKETIERSNAGASDTVTISNSEDKKKPDVKKETAARKPDVKKDATEKKPAKPNKKVKAHDSIIIEEDKGESVGDSYMIESEEEDPPNEKLANKKTTVTEAKPKKVLANRGKKGKGDDPIEIKGDQGEIATDPIIIDGDEGSPSDGTGKTNQKPKNPPGGDSDMKKLALGPSTRGNRKSGSELQNAKTKAQQRKRRVIVSSSDTDDSYSGNDSKILWLRQEEKKGLGYGIHPDSVDLWWLEEQISERSWQLWDGDEKVMLPRDPGAPKFQAIGKEAIKQLKAALNTARRELKEIKEESNPSVADQAIQVEDCSEKDERSSIRSNDENNQPTSPEENSQKIKEEKTPKNFQKVQNPVVKSSVRVLEISPERPTLRQWNQKRQNRITPSEGIASDYHN